MSTSGMRRRCHLTLRTVIFAALAIVLWHAPQASAATSTWTDGSGNWSLAANWSGGVPVAASVVNITLTDGVGRNITYDYTGAPVTLGTLTVDLTNFTGSATTLLSMSANNITTAGEFIGDSGAGSNGTGAFAQSGGINTISSTNQLYLGFNSTDKGIYLLSGGASLSDGGTENVGYSGTGTFNQTGGTNTVGLSLYLGENSGSAGTYALSGNASLTVSGTEFVGNTATGTFNQSGGTNFANNLYIGNGSTSNGAYNLSGTASELTVDGNEYVGLSGTGTVNQTNGTSWISSGFNLFLGYSSGSSGTYTLSQGSVSAGGNVYVGGSNNAAGGKGVLTVSGGDFYFPNNTSTLVVYNTVGSGLTLSNSGTITTGSLNLSGNLALFNWSSGEVDLNNESITIDNSAAQNFGDSASAAGTLALSSAQTLSVSGSETIGYNSTGTITQAGSNTVGGDVYIGYNTGSTGALTLSGNATLPVTGNVYVGGSNIGPGGKGTLTVGGSSSVTIPSTGTLTVYNTSGTSLTLSGGTLSTGSLNLSGNLALFNWTGGTLILTNPNVNAIIDTAANGGNLASSLALSTNQSLSVAGTEIVGNSGAVNVTQSGGTNTLSQQHQYFVPRL